MCEGERDAWVYRAKVVCVCVCVSQVLSVVPPSFVELTIVDCPPGVKGNTAGSECTHTHTHTHTNTHTNTHARTHPQQAFQY